MTLPDAVLIALAEEREERQQDGLVRVSRDDLRAEFLARKLVEGTNIRLTREIRGDREIIVIDALAAQASPVAVRALPGPPGSPGADGAPGADGEPGPPGLGGKSISMVL